MKITLLEVWDNIAETMQITIQNGDQIGENKNIKFSPTLCDYTISEFDIQQVRYSHGAYYADHIISITIHSQHSCSKLV